jgi:formylmethanofuran dehydrogenase subunit E
MDNIMEITDLEFKEVIDFHGHVCPGIAYGIKVALCALEKLGPRAEDEELVAIVENDACPVDAVQVLTGCTFGKGNLIFRNHGKQAYTFLNRNTGDGIRISFKNFKPQENAEEKAAWEAFSSGDRSTEVMTTIEKRKANRIKQVLNTPADDLFEINPLSATLPEKARIFPSVDCAVCHEKVMEPMARITGGKIVCIPCASEAAAQI